MGLLHTLLTTTILGRGTPAWTPANLFPTGTEEGLFLDFSDISTLYTSQTFATNISAIGDPVGGVLDKSQGLVLGAEKLTNGGFDTDLTGWTAAAGFSVSGGKLIGATVGDKIFQDAGITAGEVYSFTITGVVGEWGVRLGQDISNDYTITADGTYFITPGASYSTTDFRLRVNTAGSELASISVKKLSGNHLIQSTAAARPIWTRHPKSGVRNLYNAGTITGGGDMVVAVDIADPVGGTSAFTLEAQSTSDDYFYASLPAGVSLTNSVWLRRRSGSGTINMHTPGNIAQAVAVTSDWTRFSVSGSSPSGGASSAFIGVRIATLGDQVDVFGFQHETGSTATTYQTRVSQYDVTEAGVDDCYGLTFDGVDDYMAPAAAFALGGTKLTVAAGVFKAQESSTSAVLGVGLLSALGDWMLTAPGSSGAKDYYFGYKSVATSYTADTGTGSYDAPTTDVIVGYTDASDIGVLRVNGSQAGVAPAAFDGSFGGTPYLGASNNSGSATVRFTGTIYGVTLTDYTLDAEQLAALETWTAARTPEVFLWPRDFLGLTGTHDYYIDATLGNDANDGSEGAPWASLNKIDGSFLSAGATTRVLVRAGTYDKATDFIEVVGTALNSEINIAFEPGCVMDGTATAGAENGFEFTGTVAYVSRIYGNGLVVRDYVDVSEATSPNGVGNRGDNHLTVHDVYVSNCNDGFSAHADATMILHDCSASACLKGAFLHDNNSIAEHYRCLFEIGTASGSNGANAATVSMALEDCIIVGTTGGCGFKMQAGNTAARCQIGDTSQRLDIDAFGATVTDSYLNVYTDGNDYHTFRRCYGKFSVRCRTPGGLDMQDCVIVGPATGQSAVVFSNFNSGGAIAMTFSGNVVATPSFQSFDATNAGQLLSGGATFAGNSLWAGAAYDADLDASLISGTITTDPQIGSADSYLMADYASAAGLAGFGSGDVVERPAAIPRELRDTI